MQASFLTDYQLLNVLKSPTSPAPTRSRRSLLEDGHLMSPDKIVEDPDLFGSYQRLDGLDGRGEQHRTWTA